MGLGKLGKFPFTDGRGQSESFLFCVITWPLLKKTLAEKSLMKQTNKTIPVSLEKLYSSLITFLQSFGYLWADGYDCSIS